jgi:hypothetical protein
MQETLSILCDERAGAGTKDRDLLLNLCNVIVAILEVNLCRVSMEQTQSPHIPYMLDGNNFSCCLFDSLVDDSKTTTYVERSVWRLGVFCERLRLTPEFFENMVFAS